MGLGTTPMKGFAPVGVSREFSLSDNEVPALLAPVGYPTGANWPQKPRRPIFGRARVRVTLLTSAGRVSHQPRRTLGRSVVKESFMLFSGKNIIVTGATGDLGTAITQRLIPQGAYVLAVASNEAGLARLITEVSGPGAPNPRIAERDLTLESGRLELGRRNRLLQIFACIDR
jgi:hypothetical protein